ncbi:Nucleoside triphosphate hydrolase [Planctomycetales bacterium 10988]|nr:Nucleoside triphosphate hydrolase [Planctomycetales bacterium 10988]
MRISRLQIENFRNFKELDVEVGSHLVIVGENRVGKSNLLHALRLVLDPSLPDSARRLRLEDFWDGAKPLQPDTQITISVDLTDFEDNEKQFAVLSDYSVAHSPMIARLTYAFFPRPDLDEEPTKESDYDFSVYGGDDPTRLLSPDVRRRLPMDVLPALRDAESDLANWRRSPMRPLLDSLSGEMDEDAKEELAQAMTEAANAIANTSEVKGLSDEIKEALKTLAGKSHSDSPSLAFAPTDADRLIRTLRLFIDDGVRGISEASLGSSNLIYLALKLLSLELEISEKVRDHGFVAIEEPEAHLHPHVQRRVFRSFLRPRNHLPTQEERHEPDRTILLTTHSPHVASVSPLTSIVLLRSQDAPSHSTARSVIGAGFTVTETDDLERYLDVTRGELLFAKGVVLVEGEAEEYLVPVLAQRLGYDLDELGVSVCSVAGTNFIPYVKLLSDKALGIPFAVITDEDPRPEKECLAAKRVRSIVTTLFPEYDYSEGTSDLFAEAEEDGVFVTDHTLEVALFRCGRHKSVTSTIEQLSSNSKATERAKMWRDDTSSLEESRLLSDIEEIGKGRFSQRLSCRIQCMTSTACPSSIRKAIEHVVGQL